MKLVLSALYLAWLIISNFLQTTIPISQIL